VNRSSIAYNDSMKTVTQPTRILFVYLANPKFGKYEIERGVTELWNLVESLGNASVMDLFIQKGSEHIATYIGPGKAAEISEYLKTNPIDFIIFNGHLKPTQKFTLTKIYWNINPNIRIWDRVDLILAIFERHAHTREATLQIELARMRHTGPSIYGMGLVLSRQGGGVGTRGIGETNTELMKRHWKREIKRVTDVLYKLTKNRQSAIDNRKTKGITTVSIVGYTNAGKTSLFNLFTHKKNQVEHALFVTLDSAVGKMFLPKLGKSVLVSDTIGFIRDLPPDLIDAFRSTLLESIHADVMLHVIDAADPDMMEKIDLVDTILDELKVQKEKIIRVYNKIDIAESFNREKISAESLPYPHVFISSVTYQGIDTLMTTVLPHAFTKESG